MKEQSRQIERLETNDKEQAQQIGRLLFMEKEKSQKIDRLEEDKPKVEEQIEQLISKVDEQSQEIEKLQHTPGYSPFVWKIPNSEAVCKRLMTKEQKALFSEPFYLFSYGYKLRIKMECTEILFFGPFSRRFDFSLYLNVVPGEFDSLLSWPFKEKVRVTLIDQEPCQEIRENISRVIDFQKQGFPCPRQFKEISRDYGFRDFVDRDALRSRSYIRNDTIFIMISKE